MGAKEASFGLMCTPFEVELLDILVEECAEVIQATQKIKRFGKDERDPFTQIVNTNKLATEVGQLLHVISCVNAIDIYSYDTVKQGAEEKMEKMSKFMRNRQ